MAKITYNEYSEQMELIEASSYLETQFIVPPYMKDGDNLTPFRFTMFPWKSLFYLFGRYHEKSDMIQCVIAGPAEHKYKVSFSDGNSPYGWKIKKHGITRNTIERITWSDELIGKFLTKFLTMVGKSPSPSYMREMIKADAYVMEDVIGIPMAMLRLSHKAGVMDAKAKCIGAWSFFGPSLPEAFCRCRLKIMIYHDSWGDPRPQPVLTHTYHHQQYTVSTDSYERRYAATDGENFAVTNAEDFYKARQKIFSRSTSPYLSPGETLRSSSASPVMRVKDHASHARNVIRPTRHEIPTSRTFDRKKSAEHPPIKPMGSDGAGENIYQVPPSSLIEPSRQHSKRRSRRGSEGKKKRKRKSTRLRQASKKRHGLIIADNEWISKSRSSSRRKKKKKFKTKVKAKAKKHPSYGSQASSKASRVKRRRNKGNKSQESKIFGFSKKAKTSPARKEGIITFGSSDENKSFSTKTSSPKRGGSRVKSTENARTLKVSETAESKSYRLGKDSNSSEIKGKSNKFGQKNATPKFSFPKSETNKIEVTPFPRSGGKNQIAKSNMKSAADKSGKRKKPTHRNGSSLKNKDLVGPLSTSNISLGGSPTHRIPPPVLTVSKKYRSILEGMADSRSGSVGIGAGAKPSIHSEKKNSRTTGSSINKGKKVSVSKTRTGDRKIVERSSSRTLRKGKRSKKKRRRNSPSGASVSSGEKNAFAKSRSPTKKKKKKRLIAKLDSDLKSHGSKETKPTIKSLRKKKKKKFTSESPKSTISSGKHKRSRSRSDLKSTKKKAKKKRSKVRSDKNVENHGTGNKRKHDEETGLDAKKGKTKKNLASSHLKIGQSDGGNKNVEGQDNKSLKKRRKKKKHSKSKSGGKHKTKQEISGGTSLPNKTKNKGGNGLTVKVDQNSMVHTKNCTKSLEKSMPDKKKKTKKKKTEPKYGPTKEKRKRRGSKTDPDLSTIASKKTIKVKKKKKKSHIESKTMISEGSVASKKSKGAKKSGSAKRSKDK